MKRFVVIFAAIMTVCFASVTNAAMFYHENDPLTAAADQKLSEIQMKRYLESVEKEGGFVRVEEDDFTVEIPEDWKAWTDGNTFNVTKDGRDTTPIMTIQNIGRGTNPTTYLQKRIKELKEAYGSRIVEAPSLVIYLTATNKELNGVTCTFRSIKGDKIGHVIEYVDTVGKDVYRYYYVFMTDPSEDNPSRKEFIHLVETFQEL